MFSLIEYFKNKKTIKNLKPILLNKKIVYLTGAGISIESGILPFRGKDGIYTKDPELMYKLRPDSFESDPFFLYNFHENFRIELINKMPNRIHYIINKTAHSVITQNIDDLHEISGSKNVIHVHGDVNSFRCRKCNYNEIGSFEYEQLCVNCLSPTLRHNVVLFKESVINQDKVMMALRDSEVFIMIGSSGTIYPVAGYPEKFNGVKICINPELPENYEMFDYILIGNPRKILESLFK